MKKYIRNILVLAAVALMMVPVSCKKDDDEIESKPYMEGNVEFDLPDYIFNGEKITLTCSGIEKPSNVIYKWRITHYNDTILGNTVTVRFPDSLANYLVSVTASDPSGEYYQSTTSKYITVVDTTFATGSLTGVSRGDKFIVDSRDGKAYYYSTIGSLDWFIQNLEWEGAGSPFANSEVLNHIYGRFYNWNEATGGVKAEGLGQGPQGAYPEGWSVPTAEDWNDLGSALCGKDVKFTEKWSNVGEKLTTVAYFNGEKLWPYSPEHNSQNEYNWGALPCGFTQSGHTMQDHYYEYGFWWSSSERSAGKAYYRYIYWDEPVCGFNYVDEDDMGMNVRCVRLKK